MGRIFGRFLSDLIAGDPVALIVAGVIGFIALLILLFWWKTARDLRREDEERKQKRRGGKKS
jgi:F0F1-type ATP synthase assembly protein I